MEAKDYLRYIVEEIHSTVFATVNREGRPITCAIDMMDYDADSLYFLTAKGKHFYDRLKANENIAFTAMKGKDTLSCIAVSVQGKTREIGPEKIPDLFAKNPYMAQIYPNESSRNALTVFQIYQGTGEWFDLTHLPPERASFAFGGASQQSCGYFITSQCTGCGLCHTRCPEKCIDLSSNPAVIHQEHCIHCGNCMEVCPAGAIQRL